MGGHSTHVVHDTRQQRSFLLLSSIYNNYYYNREFSNLCIAFSYGTLEWLGLMIHLTVSLSKPIGLTAGLIPIMNSHEGRS